MKVSEARFQKRYNVAQYEHEEYSLTAVVDEDESAVEVLAQLKADIQEAYDGAASGNAEPEPEEEKPKKKKSKAKAEESEDEESAEDQETDEATEEEESEETESEETEETEGEEDEKPVKAKKGFKKKPQAYQRSNETHKDIFTSRVLKAVAPDWKKTTESKAKAKKVSMKLEGEDFLDESGEVLASFKAAAKKLMAAKK